MTKSDPRNLGKTDSLLENRTAEDWSLKWTVLTLSQVFMVSSCLKISVTTSLSPLKEQVTLTGVYKW